MHSGLEKQNNPKNFWSKTKNTILSTVLSTAIVSGTFSQPAMAAEATQVDQNAPVIATMTPLYQNDRDNFDVLNKKYMDQKLKYEDLKPEEQKEYMKSYNKVMWDIEGSQRKYGPVDFLIDGVIAISVLQFVDGTRKGI